MPKLPFMRFYPADYLLATRALTDTEKAIWMDLLCFMWLKDSDKGWIETHREDLARMVGRDRLTLDVTLDALQTKGVCNLKDRQNQVVFVECRRMVRDAKSLELNNKRQKRFNASHNETLTPKKSEVRSQKTDKDLKTNGYVNPPKDGGPTAEDLASLWNDTAHKSLPRVQVLTDTRKRKVAARLREHPDQPFWESLLSKINRSPLLTGQEGSWRCTFDWVLEPANLTKILEGNYEPGFRR